jgi:hypothetical protein
MKIERVRGEAQVEILLKITHGILPSSATSMSSTSPSKSNDSIDVPELSSTQATLRPALPLTAIEKPGLLLFRMTRRLSNMYEYEHSYDASYV